MVRRQIVQTTTFLRLRESWCELIEDQGMQGRFVSYDQLENGELLKGGYRVFILPQSNSLSKAEADAIREFIAQGGTVIADGEPGVFNEHSRRLPASPLADLFGGEHTQPITTRTFGKGKAVFIKAATVSYLTDRIQSKEAATHKLVGDLLRQDVRPEIAVTDTSGNAVVGVESHVYRNGGVTLITLMSNPLQRVDELGPPDFRSNQRFENPVSVTVTLPATAFVYNVRTGEALGEKKTIQVTVGPYEPVILSTAPVRMPRLQVSAPAQVHRGSSVSIGIASTGTPAEKHVLHIDAIDPAGNRMLQYSGNVVAQDGRAKKVIPVALNDSTGQWTIRIRDMLSGQTDTRTLVVR